MWKGCCLRDGGPESQSETTSVTVSLYPPSISYTYQPNDSIYVDSSLSTIGNYFWAYYNAGGYFPDDYFATSTMHKTQLVFRVYAPSSSYTDVEVRVYQQARDYINNTWNIAFDPHNYYYNY